MDTPNALKLYIYSGRVIFGRNCSVYMDDFERGFEDFCSQNGLRMPKWEKATYEIAFAVLGLDVDDNRMIRGCII